MKNGGFIELITSRRSVRKYTTDKIPDHDIFALLRAAMSAPSAVNKQPWHFLVVNDRDLLDQLSQIFQHAAFISGASHAILVLGDEKLQHDDGFWTTDCGAATQNILLAASAMDIGSCWVGIYPREQWVKDIAMFLDLPPHIKPYSLVTLGYPEERLSPADRFREERIRYNRW